jgi:hypothetical protein
VYLIEIFDDGATARSGDTCPNSLGSRLGFEGIKGRSGRYLRSNSDSLRQNSLESFKSWNFFGRVYCFSIEFSSDSDSQSNMSDSSEALGSFQSQEHKLVEACHTILNAVQFVITHSDEEVITALVKSDNMDLENVAMAATRLTEFSTALVEAKQNVLVAYR